MKTKRFARLIEVDENTQLLMKKEVENNFQIIYSTKIELSDGVNIDAEISTRFKTESDRDEAFEEEIDPVLARSIVDQLIEQVSDQLFKIAIDRENPEG